VSGTTTVTREARASLPLAGELPAPAVAPRHALLAKGFRPFFLAASAFAVAIVPAWLLILGGAVAPLTYLDATSWHAHEMVFGFAVAVIAGFLLTAAGNWTQRETAVDAPLLGLVALWAVGRVAMVAAGALPRGVAAAVDLAFLPVLAVVLARPIVLAKSWRNLVMIAVVGGLFAANVTVHLAALGVLGLGAARRACLVGVDVVVLVILVMAGRVFPMFTRNATGVAAIRSLPSLDRATLAGMTLLVLLDVVAPEGTVASAASGVVGLIAAARAVHWGARHTLRVPLLRILHAGYAWVPIGLLLRGVAGFVPSVPRSLTTHALTVGAIGCLTLGMMARVALGHTGRPLVAAKPMVGSFAALVLAALARVVVPLLAPAWYFQALVVSGGLWAVAFLAFVLVYAPLLSRPRVDGKPG